jgi:hypothetical protein
MILKNETEFHQINSMIRRLILLFVFIPVAGFTQTQKDLVGFWQDMPIAASGWSDSYLLYSDGTYEFNFNQMICDKRLLSLKGSWEIDKDDNLVLITISKTVLEGGTLVPSSGSCASEFDIEGGEIITKVLSIPEKKIVSISGIITDVGNNSLKSMLIDNVRYWRISVEPGSYY